MLQRYTRRFKLATFVETGTYLGETVQAMRPLCRQIYSVELSPKLAKAAQERFAGDPRIRIIQGDSTKALPRILHNLTEPTLFWLDAHYSGGITARGAGNTPVLQELRYILRHWIPGHVVLIDDARLFLDQREYPDYPTLEEIRELVRSNHPELTVEVRDDIIRIRQKT